MPGGLHLHRSELSPGPDGPPTPPRASTGPVALAVGVVGAAWLLAAPAHAAAIPRTDDWAFARVALTLHATGHVHLVVWALPWLALLGAHLWVLDLSASVLVAAGLVAAHRLARTVTGPGAALI